MPKMCFNALPAPDQQLPRLHLHGPIMGTRWSVTLDADLSGPQQAALLHDLGAAVAQVEGADSSPSATFVQCTESAWKLSRCKCCA